MNLKNTIKLHCSSDGLGPGAVGLTNPNNAVISPSMRKMGGRTQVEADASPSDFTNTHAWQEPSATDRTILTWQLQREMEKKKGRSMDPFETQAEIQAGGPGSGRHKTLTGDAFKEVMSKQPKSPEALDGVSKFFSCTRCGKEINSPETAGFIDKKGLPVHAKCGKDGEVEEYQHANNGNGYKLSPKYFPAWHKG